MNVMFRSRKITLSFKNENNKRTRITTFGDIKINRKLKYCKATGEREFLGTKVLVKESYEFIIIKVKPLKRGAFAIQKEVKKKSWKERIVKAYNVLFKEEKC